MSTLSKEYRRQLENTVLKAREEAERGAAAALESFGVADAKLPSHLDEAGKNLRRKLRAHGRQVGDVRRPDDSQEVEHLIRECAYEHWHRMLFARFLAENGFLIEPESGMDVDLEFCEERAREKSSDKWEVAADFAQKMLLDVFRSDDSVLQLRLPAESRNRLTGLLASLPRDVFLADDSLGWVYQFWQAKKKQEVNDSGVKIGADELAPVTQLFTEDYMVEFLLHNTLGAWWAEKTKARGERLKAEVNTEEEARKAVALPAKDGVPAIDWKYLRFAEKDGKWTPAVGAFEGWPNTVKKLRVLDPCMGSGHFLVFALVILVRIRMEEEGASATEACVSVLRDNLFGLELDPRCTQIAAFNLALAAWKLGGYQKELSLNLACSGMGLNMKKEDWVNLAVSSPNLRFGMGALYDLFQKAPVLGSLINPRRDRSVTYSATLQELQPLLKQALQREETDEAHELAVTAQGVAKAAEILAGQFTLVTTNVPYLGRGKQNDMLRAYCEGVHSQAKADLATCFVERCLSFCGNGGATALVTPQNWLFLGTYKKMRERLFRESTWNAVAKLGPAAFQDMNWWAANTVIFVITNEEPPYDADIAGLDVSKPHDPQEKATLIKTIEVTLVPQSVQVKNPDARLLLRLLDSLPLLEQYAVGLQGISPADYAHYGRFFWELIYFTGWRWWQSTIDETTAFGGRELVLWWNQDLKDSVQAGSAFIRGEVAWGKSGVVVRQMRHLPCCIYTGEAFDTNCAVIVPHDPRHIPAVWTFCSSDEFAMTVRQIDQKTNVTNSTLVKVPFDLAHWQKVAAEKYPNGLPRPFSSDPTQWLFNGHPKGSDHPLQVAVARLACYRWPRQTGLSFPDCPALGPDGLEKHADNDGVVCFSQVRDEPPAATRLRALLADAYGAEWSHAMERKLIAVTGSKAESLEEWLLNDFFAQHCDLFHNRPFAWHIWDGRKDGFNVLVNYHRLAGPDGRGARTLETLAYAYLGDWITRQKDAAKRDEAGAEDRLAAALELQGELKKILAGELPYDLFIRWRPLHQQPIGWEPDINDGVRLNIRAFMVATLSRGKKGCGILRAKPGSSVKWDKDRGKEPSRPKEDFPWFWKWDEQTVDFAGDGEFDGNRWNDCHYTTAFKRAARERKAKK
jgi:hypothetical protein